MKIIKGNIWDFWNKDKDSPICITTNGILSSNGRLVMGKGIALEAKQKCLDDIDWIWGKMISWYGNKPFYYESSGLLSFPTKHHWRENSDINLVLQSAKIIKEMMEFYALGRIFSPKPGCGLGGLSWDVVKPKLEEVWDSGDFVIVEKEKI